MKETCRRKDDLSKFFVLTFTINYLEDPYYSTKNIIERRACRFPVLLKYHTRSEIVAHSKRSLDSQCLQQQLSQIADATVDGLYTLIRYNVHIIVQCRYRIPR